MTTMVRYAFVSLLIGGSAFAQTAPSPAADPSSPTSVQKTDDGQPKKKEPKAGDFDAGGQVRLPSGPDENGKFASFNWIALDAKGQYVIAKWLVVNGTAPLALKKPDTAGVGGPEPSIVGGLSARLEARMPKYGGPFAAKMKDTDVALAATVAYMREGAMLLSDKDYPLFVGDFKPGFAGSLLTRVKLGSIVDFKLDPAWVYQAGTMESHAAVQVPMSLLIKLGETVQTSADLGVYTGDHYSFRGSNGGRIAAGGSLTLKIGPIVAHAGAGVASLLTGGFYPTIRDSVYVDLNVKYAK